jgi:hypothetical protein
VLFRLLGYLIGPKIKPKYQPLFQNIINSSSTGVSFFTRDKIIIIINQLKNNNNNNKQGVCHTMALPFTLKHILRQKKNYKNSNISCKNIRNLQKKDPLKRNQNSSKIL